jgi:uridine monophosphate synthetase
MSYKQGLLNQIFEVGCVIRKDIPEFRLKSGRLSDLYVDLRKLISHPKLLHQVANSLNEELDRHFQSLSHVAGIVAGGVPLCTLVSQISQKPMIMIRSERKKHGAGNLIEGLPPSETVYVVLIEDVLTTGTSVRETIAKIDPDARIEIIGCICVVNRSGQDIVPETKIPLFSLWQEHDLVQVPIKRRTLLEREIIASDTMAKRIFKTMQNRKTNLIWSADTQNVEDLYQRLDMIGEYLLGVKMHYDAFTKEFDIKRFRQLVEKYNLIVINDRKYADIEATVYNQAQADK